MGFLKTLNEGDLVLRVFHKLTSTFFATMVLLTIFTMTILLDRLRTTSRTIRPLQPQLQ